MALTMVSSGSVTSFTASSALSPSARTEMSTIGTEICGSSSRGKANGATMPSAKAASNMSGVSGERMKARVNRPEMPSSESPFMAGSAGHRI
jgi:hypothetical protein